MIRAWWSAREPRERILLLVALGLSLAAVLWQGVLVPSRMAVETAERRLESALVDLASVRAAREARAGARAAPTRDQPLQSVLSETADLYGLTISRISPAENEGLNIWLDEVSPQLLYAWISELEARHGVRVGKASLRREGESGRIAANLYLERDI